MSRLLHVTSPLMTGADVLAVQKELRSFGAPIAADGKYGPSTMDAVEAFQENHHIGVDGIVGPATLTALEKTTAPKIAPKPLPPAAVRPSKPTLGLLAVEAAVRYIGIAESPAGSNKQPFGAWFGMNGVPWCNIFVSFCTETGAKVTICKDFKGAGVTSKGCSYVPTTEAWFKSPKNDHDWLSHAAPIVDGLVPCYNWDGGVPDHIGFAVTEATLQRLVPAKFKAALAQFGSLQSGEFWAIEGNTAVGNDSNGGQVEIRQRTRSMVDGFGQLR